MTEHHKEYVKRQFLELVKNDYVFEKIEPQDYCEECAKFLSDREIVGTCPVCGEECNGDQCDHCLTSLESNDVKDKKCKACKEEVILKTNKHLYFHCATASVKIPYSKLVGVTPYSDGLEVHKEETKPKRTVFQGFDSWFIMSVLNHINI